MDSNALLALASRIETEPASGALLEDIARALGWKCVRVGENLWWRSTRHAEWTRYLPDWLTSMDAAVTLVPHFICWMRTSTMENGHTAAYVWLLAPSSPVMSDIKLWGRSQVESDAASNVFGELDKMPRAIAAAALRAIAAGIKE